ncbi:hypothetical protein Lal_00027727 [Lupinus albus]|uniref:Uncharacterized protein n=1 Tax=Lupinus albus TaxID=3870 RepID=A0A6A5MLB3_LUPAL|nr:hypothetical protein Lalb_Chr05g0211671 [Lupinus albus]KAF1873689.1 hypothetical protein Lal_00027727 [Lupinus albus]
MKSGEGKAEKEEKLGEKLRAVLGKSKGICTPLPYWKTLWEINKDQHHHHHQQLFPSTVSARNLAAALWEFHQHFQMHHRGAGGAGGDPRLRRHHYNLHKDKAIVAPEISNFLGDASLSSPDHHPGSATSLRRHVAASLMQHHPTIERNNHALQPVSPASYGSSMEMTPYNPAATPTSSMEFKGRIRESRYGLKTSTELLKVLNRIWSLEEQHASNISLIKALKAELDHARIRVKELLRDRQADRHEIDDLMKQVAEDKLVRKSKEQDRLLAAVQSVRDELEDERKLRKRSESIHRKLARELSEVKSSFANALKELEQERTRRKLMEDLCDEFARGINEYEQEVHVLKQKSDKDWDQRADHDCLILHISESWLDERMQMQLEAAQNGIVDKKSIVDKLSLEIETFLKAKQNSKNTENLVERNRRNSLESVRLNDAVSAPRDVGDDDSVGSDSNCFELNKPNNKESKLLEKEPLGNNFEEALKSKHIKKKTMTQEGLKYRSPSNLQVKFEEQMGRAMSSKPNKKSQPIDTEEGRTTETKAAEGTVFETSEQECEIRENNTSELQSSSKKHIVDNLIRGQVLTTDSGNIHGENNYGEASCSNAGWRNQASPLKQWMTKLTSQDVDISETSKVHPGSRENTLKAKLLEARSKGQRSRLKALKGSF